MLNSLQAWSFFMLLFCLLTFFKTKLFQKILSGTLSEYQTVWIKIGTDTMSVLIWVHTVCKGYQKMTKDADSKGRDKQEMSQTRDECPQRNWSSIRHI